MHANYADTSMFAGQAGQAVHATYADTSMFAGQAGQTVHATYADSAGFVDLSGLILPESFVSYAQEDITLPTSWTSIYAMTISISANMKLHTKAFIYRTPVDGGGFGGQLAIADQNGNILEAPASSARFPTTFENTLYSDYVFDVTPGTYIIALFGVGNGTDLAESVFIEVLAMPSSGNRQLNNLELIENNFPYTDGEPIRLSN